MVVLFVLVIMYGREFTMSKFGLIIGLVFSVVLHAWLFRYGVSPVDVPAVERSSQADSMPATVDVATIAKKQAVQPKQDKPELAKTEPKEEVKQVEKQPAPKVSQIPELTETRPKQKTNQEQSGDFAGSANGVVDPVVRINWGDLTNAVSILNTSGMKLVIYESDGSVKRQVITNGSEVSTKSLDSTPTIRYSDSLRIVDRVPAFAAIKTALKLGGSEHLAVLVPVLVEREIESAKMTEVSRRSLSLRDVKVLGGRFNVTEGKVIFIIEKVLLRS
jgi:hypothetical protein